MGDEETTSIAGRRLAREDVLIAAESIVDRDGWAGLTEQDLAPAMIALFAAHHGVIVLEISHFFEDRIDLEAVFSSVVDGSLRTISELVARSKATED